jgi:hypothetical protein
VGSYSSALASFDAARARPKGRREFGVIRSVESCARVVEFGGEGVRKLGWSVSTVADGSGGPGSSERMKIGLAYPEAPTTDPP